MKFAVKNHDENDFDISALEVKEDAKTRTHLALSIFYVCIGFLICSALYGFKADNFNALQTVFDHIQIPMATVIGYYFGARNG